MDPCRHGLIGCNATEEDRIGLVRIILSMTSSAGRPRSRCKRRFLYAFAFMGAVVGTAVGSASPAFLPAASEPHLHMVTYINRMSPVFAFLQVSAEAHGLHPEILGYGEVAWWPDGLGTKINALRRFVFGPLADQDIVVFLDAFDVMVFGGKDLLVEKFVAMERQRNRSLFFNAEAACFPPFDDICTPNYPQSPHEQWRYLNSGMIIGRVSAMRHMLQEPVDNIIKGSDQAFYQRHFLRYPDEVGLDYSCFLLCATQVIGHKHGIVIQDRQAVNLLTGENIALVHFVSMGHWTIWKSGSPTTIIGDVFGDLYPEEYERLFGSVNFFLQVGSAHWVVLAELRGRAHDAYCAIARMVLCCKCRLFLSGDRECTYARTLLGSFCFHTSVFLLLVICLPISAIFVRRRRYVSVNALEKAR